VSEEKKEKSEELRKETLTGFQIDNGREAVFDVLLYDRLVFLKSVYGFPPQLFAILSSLFSYILNSSL